MIHIFCDMDGVIANFEKHFKDKLGYAIHDISRNQQFKHIQNFSVEWWATIPWMEDGKQLWDYLINNFTSVHILSSPSIDKEQKSNLGKIQWLTKNQIVNQIGLEKCIIDINKHHHIKKDGMSILIDDNEKKINKWNEVGGVGILHKNTKETIQQLQKYDF